MLLTPCPPTGPSSVWRHAYVLQTWATAPCRSVRRAISCSKKPASTRLLLWAWKPARSVAWSVVSPSAPVPGIRMSADGWWSVLSRAQSRGWPAGPETTS
ncbi:MAG: hypothetical protein CMM85_07905 [Rhodothermaceae bacterium]|nr:hypothetical protein [Rhodothermaceae bacterium]